MRTLSVRAIAIAVFGCVAPLLLMIQAGVGLYTLTKSLADPATRPTVAQVLPSLRPQLRDVNDYIMSSHLIAEGVNQAVMVNKQTMKAVVMQVGFAVASVGLMFILLGITDGGAEGGLEHGLGKINFKTSSTGAIVFVTGAAMVAGGGLLRNDYKTLSVPNYVMIPQASVSAAPQALSELKLALDGCLKATPGERGACMENNYTEIKRIFQL
jgi:hypothetical protein